MHDFFIKELFNTDMNNELINIGYDSTYSKIGSEKFVYKNFKIYGLSCAQANIIKQTALSVGADCGTHKNIIVGMEDKSNCILGGSLSQLAKISDKLKLQPFNLKQLGLELEELLCVKQTKTKIIGILNITQNSFSDGGEYYKFDDSVRHLHKLIDDGADIIDIGAESTKPYSQPVLPKEQMKVLKPVLEYINKENIKVPISIDTRSSLVAQECINLGANIINDVSGLDYDADMVNVLSKNSDVRIIIQHSNGTPENMQNGPFYENLMDELYLNLNKKVDFALSNGIKKENIIIDPGIGFGKTTENNFEILRRWKELKTLGCPVLIGLSRKSLLNMPDAENEEKDLYSLALDSILVNDGIDYIRVHNVKIHKNLCKMLG